MEYLISLVLPFLISNPHFAVLVTFMAGGRLIFKPLCSLIQAYVDATPTLKDNLMWKDAQESKHFKAVSYVLDFFSSIKLPK